MPLYGFYSGSLARSMDAEIRYTRPGVEYVLDDPATFSLCTCVVDFETEEEAMKYFENYYKKHNVDASFVGIVGEYIDQIGKPRNCNFEPIVRHKLATYRW
jgi:hypothetical protein